MNNTLLIQLPVPQTNFGRQTGNVPLAAAWLAQSAAPSADNQVTILPESEASYLGDAALIDRIIALRPTIVGFTVYCWNLDRSLYIAGRIKQLGDVRIIFGGPEITPDNPRLTGSPADFLVYGEGEAVFQRLHCEPGFWKRGSASAAVDGIFESNASPYLSGWLDPGPGNLMLLETQRGCPYHCGYCHYNKSRQGLSFASETLVFDAIDWARERRVGEIYLLDPCLSARPRLHAFLAELAARNRDHLIGFVSEIRAESIDAPLADRCQDVGFRWLEIGLQSTNPRALELMNRRTNLKRLAQGAHLLKERGIRPQIDLILGLPGDDLAGFKRSVDFLAENGLADDVQIFPLSVLPGTDFRMQCQALGLNYTPAPPYTVLETPTFSQKEMRQAIAYAEESLDAAFYPFPDLNIAWRTSPSQPPEDVIVRIGDQAIYTKLYLQAPRPDEALQSISKRLGYPYQLFVDPYFSDEQALCRMLSVLSEANPFTPFEIIFLSPDRKPNLKRVLSAVRLKRPHFLDLEERFLFDRPGNRAVIFTFVALEARLQYTEEMVRQVFWWKKPNLPERQELDDLLHLDGVLIDSPLPESAIAQWQDRFTSIADDLPHIAFADLPLQHRWLLKTAPDQWAESVLRKFWAGAQPVHRKKK